jgi:hypothetical protein
MIPKYTSIDVSERRAAGERHRNFQFGAQNDQQVHDADSARNRKCMHDWLVYHHNTRAERDGLEHVAAASCPRSSDDDCLAAERLGAAHAWCSKVPARRAPPARLPSGGFNCVSIRQQAGVCAFVREVLN